MELFKAKLGSPVTQLAENITNTQTTITLVNADVLPDAPNIATIGTGVNAETIRYSGKTLNTLTGVTRGFSGTAKAWATGQAIARIFTQYDWDSVVESVLGYEGIYGVEWNKATDDMTRVAGASSFTLSNFDNIYPWAGMRRCVVNDAGTVIAYYGDPTYVEDGSTGQVMVEIPKFWYRAWKTDVGYRWEISPIYKTDFRVHPAFIKGQQELDYIYIGAYEGSVYDVSATAYLLADEQVADFTATTGDKLSSRANAKPASGLTQALNIVNSRILAKNRGTGWQLQDFNTVSAIQLLFIVEYATFNTQTAIGLGVVNKASGTGNEAENTGQTSTLGNASGMASGTNGLVSVSYRGIENFWGNIWNWVDGLNIQADNKPYIANDNYASDKFTDDYEWVGGTLANANGYVSDIFLNSEYNYGFLATEVAGGSTIGLCDYYYQSIGNRVAVLGGFWAGSVYAGGFCFALHFVASSSARAVGSRLAFKK